MFDEWVKFHLNYDENDSSTEKDARYLNDELARVFGKDRDAQSQFLIDVNDEVLRRKSAERIDYDTAWTEAHAENERLYIEERNERNTKLRDRHKHLAERALMHYSKYCDNLGEVPTKGLEGEMYSIGSHLKEIHNEEFYDKPLSEEDIKDIVGDVRFLAGPNLNSKQEGDEQ